MIRQLLLAMVVASGPAVADEAWRVELTADAAAAVAESEDRVRLSVATGPSRYSADCRLTLPEGSGESLDGQFLVSLTVDANEPLTVLRWQGQPEEDDGGDFFEVIRRAAGGIPRSGGGPNWIAFRCWPALRGEESPASGALREMLEGRRLVVRYATVEGGTQQAAFSLDGAREAIAEALQISAAPSPKDVAQAELLRFRFDYRSNTCYLLRGRKRQKRCLEAVNRCAEQVHDSVQSMVDCIEGK